MGRSTKSRGARKLRVMFRRMGVWLDSWCLRGYSQDTHAWPAKIEKLRGLKRTARQTH
jgi:hypothetical protein